jgi:hypothetical protein
VRKNAFEIIFAFDEAIAMGYNERVNVGQIKTFLAMESMNERRVKEELQVSIRLPEEPPSCRARFSTFFFRF